MYRRERIFIGSLLLVAVMAGCSDAPEAAKSIDNPSSTDASDKSAAANTTPAMQWPPPAAQAETTHAPAPVLPSRILTKDPQYRSLIKPPTGDEFLKLYSAEYNAKVSQVEAGVAAISDKTLQDKARLDGWKGVDKADFQKQAVEAHATKLREYMAMHRDGWVELGHCEYDSSTRIFKVYSIPASPFQGTNKFEVPMDIATADAVYNKFRPLAEPRISARIDRDVMEYFVQEDSTVYSREQVASFLRAQRYKNYESSIRLEQMVVIGRGDLAGKNIEHISVVDYSTETVLLDLDPSIFTNSNPTWLY
jgi:hypothetical protein